MSIKKILSAAVFYAVMQGTAQATVIYDAWTTNDGDTGNYILSITDTGTGFFDFNLTVDPWNAEALGVFIDLGAATITDTALTNVVPVNEVSLFATDTASNNCGAGCNLNGLAPSLVDPDSEWEYVFRLGSQGFDSIQTFSWTIGNSGYGESDIVMAGIRSQVLCPAGVTIPDASCTGSDKSYSTVPEPSLLALLSIGLVGMGVVSKRRKR